MPALVPNIENAPHIVLTQCPDCGKFNTVECSYEGYQRWKGGEIIQVALPELNRDQAELLQTGMCQKCWDKIFADPCAHCDESTCVCQ